MWIRWSYMGYNTAHLVWAGPRGGLTTMEFRLDDQTVQIVRSITLSIGDPHDVPAEKYPEAIDLILDRGEYVASYGASSEDEVRAVLGLAATPASVEVAS